MILSYLGALLLLTYLTGKLDQFIPRKIVLLPAPPPPTRAEYFLPGQPVRYVPYHAEGNPNHPDCENGFVSSVNPTTQTVFVRFSLGCTAQACKPDQLV